MGKFDVIFGTNLVFVFDDPEQYSMIVKNLCRYYLNPGGIVLFVQQIPFLQTSVWMDNFTSYGFDVKILQTTPRVFNSKRRGPLIFISLRYLQCES